MNRKSRRTAAKQLRSADFKGTDENSVALLLNQAVTAAQAGKWLDAEKILNHLLTVDPDHAEASHMMGMAMSSTGRAIEGVEFLKRATTLKPGEALYWNNLATSYSAARMLAEAVDAARKAVTLEPGYAVAWVRLGDALSDIRDFAHACDAYQRYTALAGTEPAIQKQIANCLINLGRLEEAEECLKALRNSLPGDIETLGNLGAVLVARQKYAEALPCLEAATAVDRKKYSAAFNYARALEGTGQTELAIQWLRRATSADHRSDEAWLFLGDLLLKVGQIDEALVSARRAHALRPNSTAAADLVRRVEAVRNPAAAAPVAKSSPTTWDFHLGDGGPGMNLPTGGIEVTFDQGPKNGNAAAVVPAAEKAPAAKPEKPKAAADAGIVDLTVLKIG